MKSLRKVEGVGCQCKVEVVFKSFGACCIALHCRAEWSLCESTSRIASRFTRAIRRELTTHSETCFYSLLGPSFGQMTE